MQSFLPCVFISVTGELKSMSLPRAFVEEKCSNRGKEKLSSFVVFLYHTDKYHCGRGIQTYRIFLWKECSEGALCTLRFHIYVIRTVLSCRN
jgi:hypothetical protein